MGDAGLSAQALAERVQRTGADVAEHHAERPDEQGGGRAVGVFRVEDGACRVPRSRVPPEIRRRWRGSWELKQVKKDRARAWGLLRRQRWALESGR